jgi:uncharacterized membrane protein YeaQ/YmgE (transglycosylase-associated protein family)
MLGLGFLQWRLRSEGVGKSPGSEWRNDDVCVFGVLGVHSSGPLGRTVEVSMGFLAWIVVGLIAGWLAGQVMKGGGYGVIVDIILGILGGLVGGWVFGILGIWPAGGMIGSIIVAFVGAVILVGITRLIKRAPPGAQPHPPM